MKKRITFFILSIVLVAGVILYNQLKNPNFNLETVSISIDEKSFEKLTELRDQAVEKGLLMRSKDDYVQCSFLNNNDTTEGEIRLKGDWVDHLKSDKWSFRVKLKKPMANGMKTFSLQSPKARGFLNGYVFHKLLKHHNILSNEMTFIELIVNGDSWGIYNMEEHLSERMLNLHSRPPGLILSFDDTEFFKASVNNEDLVGVIAKAKIKVKGRKQLQKENKLLVVKAKTILKNYQFQNDSLYRNFDVILMAKYYAICDVARAYHAMGWINIRFFFNFKTELMEPIGNDGYPEMKWGLPYLGNKAEMVGPNLPKLDQMRIAYSGLYNKDIKKHYKKFLHEMTADNYLKDFLKTEQVTIDFYEKEIQKEFKKYKYNNFFLIENAATIKAAVIADGYDF